MIVLSALKQTIVPRGTFPREVLFGLFRGLRFNLDLASETQVYLGLGERETFPWIRRLAVGIASGIDIGAGPNGEFTLFFLKKSSAKTVLAFEPSPDRIDHVRQSLALNEAQMNRVTVRSDFVGAKTDGKTVALDSIQGIQFPCLIKVDVDGPEVEVLRGAERLNASGDVRWLIETHSLDLENACIAYLKARGFETRIIRNAWWRTFIPETRPTAHNRWLAAWKP